MKLTIEKNISEGRTGKIFCNTCSTQTKHQIHATISEYVDDQDPEYSVQGNTDHEILSCLGCDTFSYRSVSTNSEDYHYVNERGDAEYVETIDYFPPRNTGRAAIRDVSLLPQKLEALYMETLSAHNAGHLVLTAIGLRALIETICKDHGARGGNLVALIDSLAENKIITQAAKSILHGVRGIGNDAAHEAKPAEKEALGFAIEAIEHTLIGAYVLPEREKKAFKPPRDKQKPRFPGAFNAASEEP